MKTLNVPLSGLVLAAIGLTVNRLIRISYGPFRLNELQPGEVEEGAFKPLAMVDEDEASLKIHVGFGKADDARKARARRRARMTRCTEEEPATARRPDRPSGLESGGQARA